MSYRQTAQCCWCGLKPVPGPEAASINYSPAVQQVPNQKVLKLLEALGISPLNVLNPGEDYVVCTGCCDLVSFVTVVQVRLERARLVLNSKTCEGVKSENGQHSPTELTSCCSLMSAVMAVKCRLEHVRSLLKKQACSALRQDWVQEKTEILGYKLSQCYKDCRVKLLPEDIVSLDLIREMEEKRKLSAKRGVDCSPKSEPGRTHGNHCGSDQAQFSPAKSSRAAKRNAISKNEKLKTEDVDDAKSCASWNGFIMETDEIKSDLGNLHASSSPGEPGGFPENDIDSSDEKIIELEFLEEADTTGSLENQIDLPEEKRIKLEFSEEPDKTSPCRRYNTRTRTRTVEPGFYHREPSTVIDIDDSSASETFEPIADSDEDTESDFDMLEEYRPSRSKVVSGSKKQRKPRSEFGNLKRPKGVSRLQKIQAGQQTTRKLMPQKPLEGRRDRIPNWCYVCMSAESPDHLEKQHNLVCRKRKFYYCSVCLQAFEPPDKKTPTGYYNIRNHTGFFKEFAATHRKCTAKPKSQSCRFCPRVLSTGAECIAHEYQRHSHDTKVRPDYFRCTVCSYKCSAIQGLLQHIKKNDGEHLDAARDSARLFGCSFCGAEFQTEEGLVDHVGHHKTSGFSSTDRCVVCEESEETSAADVVGHYYTQHGLDYTNFMYLSCAECSAAFQSTSGRPSGIATSEDRDALHSFINQHSACKSSTEGVQKCQFCPETVARSSLFQHELTQHPKDSLPCQKRMTCQYCHLPYDKPEQLAQHNRFHQLGTNLRNAWRNRQSGVPVPVGRPKADRASCPKCRRKFETPEALQTHKNTHLMDEQIHGVPLNLLRYDSDKCPLCKFYSCHHLTQHIRREHNLERWKIRRSNGDFYCCSTCLAPFPPSDPDIPAGKYLPNDIELELFTIFASEHKKGCKRPKFTDFECIHCDGKVFKNVRELAIHDTREHPENNGFTCQYCETKIGKEHHLRRHIKDHHAQQFVFERKCHRCWRPFKTLDELKAHYNQNHLSPTSLLTYAGFPCLSCDLIFDSVALLTLHLQEIHNKLEHLKFHCARCATTFDSLEFAVATSSSTTSAAEVPKYALQTASGIQKFRTFTALSSQHFLDCMTEHQNDPCSAELDPNLSCYSCSKKFTNTKDLAIHLNSHIDVSIALPCPVCTLLLPTEPSLTSHVVKWHNLKSPIVNFYHCNTCLLPWKHTRCSWDQGKLLPEDAEEFLSFVDQHPEDCRMEKVTSFSCDTCEFTTSILQYFYDHNSRMHSNQAKIKHKPQAYKKKWVGQNLPCKFCDALFPRSNDRTRHMNKFHKDEPEVIFKDEEIFC